MKEVLVGRKVKIVLDEEKELFNKEMREFEGKIGTISKVKHSMPFSSGMLYFEISYPDGTIVGAVDTWTEIIEEVMRKNYVEQFRLDNGIECGGRIKLLDHKYSDYDWWVGDDRIYSSISFGTESIPLKEVNELSVLIGLLKGNIAFKKAKEYKQISFKEAFLKISESEYLSKESNVFIKEDGVGVELVRVYMCKYDRYAPVKCLGSDKIYNFCDLSDHTFYKEVI